MTNTKTDLAIKVLIAGLSVALIVIIAGTLNERVVKAGDTAPDFSLTTESGRKISPANFGGKVLVLHFWGTWCAPCVREVPALSEFQKKVADAGVVVVGVSVDTNQDAYRRFLKQHPVTFLTARDPESNLSASYGTYKFPETYIIDHSGKVVQKIIGEGDWGDAMVSYVKSL